MCDSVVSMRMHMSTFFSERGKKLLWLSLRSSIFEILRYLSQEACHVALEKYMVELARDTCDFRWEEEAYLR